MPSDKKYLPTCTMEAKAGKSCIFVSLKFLESFPVKILKKLSQHQAEVRA